MSVLDAFFVRNEQIGRALGSERPSIESKISPWNWNLVTYSKLPAGRGESEWDTGHETPGKARFYSNIPLRWYSLVLGFPASIKIASEKSAILREAVLPASIVLLSFLDTMKYM